MSELEDRIAVVNEAKTWIGTPYNSNGLVKGHRGGVDCGMLPIAVYASVGLVPKEFDPRPYSPEWHVHRSEEKYLEYILRFAKEVNGPPRRMPIRGDFVLFKIGLAFAHGAIVVEWPEVIHAVGGSVVMPTDISKDIMGKRALANVPQRFFIPKSWSE